MRIPIAQCRGCLFKALCLENEKNPVIRNLVLGEEIKDDLFNEKHDDREKIQEILELMKSELNKVSFKEYTGNTLVDVYYDKNLIYKIPKNIYQRIIGEWNEEHPLSVLDDI